MQDLTKMTNKLWLKLDIKKDEKGTKEGWNKWGKEGKKGERTTDSWLQKSEKQGSELSKKKVTKKGKNGAAN